jgi:hypothetical protein
LLAPIQIQAETTRRRPNWCLFWEMPDVRSWIFSFQLDFIEPSSYWFWNSRFPAASVLSCFCSSSSLFLNCSVQECATVRCAHSLYCWMRHLLWAFTLQPTRYRRIFSLGQELSSHMKKNLWWFEMSCFISMSRTVLAILVSCSFCSPDRPFSLHILHGNSLLQLFTFTLHWNYNLLIVTGQVKKGPNL